MPINTQVMILQLYNVASDINNLFGMYFDEIKRIHVLERTKTKKTNQILTSKEIIKYQRRDLKNMNEILEFHDANEARMSGYYGQQCNSVWGSAPSSSRATTTRWSASSAREGTRPA